MVNGRKLPTSIQLRKLLFDFHLTFKTSIRPPKWEFWKLNGSGTEVEWKLPNGSVHVSTTKVKEISTFPCIPAVASIYVRSTFHPSLYASIVFTYFPLLSFVPMSFQCFHFSSAFTGSSIYVRRNSCSLSCAPTHSLYTTSTPLHFFPVSFQYPSVRFYFYGNFHLRPQKLPFTLIRRLLIVRRFLTVYGSRSSRPRPPLALAEG